jgi:mannose-1-phosphate guanylyltransferase
MAARSLRRAVRDQKRPGNEEGAGGDRPCVQRPPVGFLLVRGDFGWSDVGSWDALWEISDKDEQGNSANVKGTFVGLNTTNSLIHSSGKLVALVGVDDLIVVETGDALLVCRRGCSQDVKKVVEILEEKNMKEFL